MKQYEKTTDHLETGIMNNDIKEIQEVPGGGIRKFRDPSGSQRMGQNI
jgi:hypothetical protein